MAQLRVASTQPSANAIATNPREISLVSSILLLCFLLSSPMLAPGFGGDQTRARGGSCMNPTMNLRSYDNSYFLTAKPPMPHQSQGIHHITPTFLL